MPINPGKTDNGDEDFPQPLGTGQALISDVAPNLKRERAARKRLFPFGFVAPDYPAEHYASAHSRHRGTVRSSR